MMRFYIYPVIAEKHCQKNVFRKHHLTMCLTHASQNRFTSVSPNINPQKTQHSHRNTNPSIQMLRCTYIATYNPKQIKTYMQLCLLFNSNYSLLNFVPFLMGQTAPIAQTPQLFWTGQKVAYTKQTFCLWVTSCVNLMYGVQFNFISHPADKNNPSETSQTFTQTVHHKKTISSEFLSDDQRSICDELQSTNFVLYDLQ